MINPGDWSWLGDRLLGAAPLLGCLSAVSGNESERTVKLWISDRNQWAEIVMDVSTTILIARSLLNALPIDVEIDYDVFRSDPVDECVRDAKRRNLSMSDLMDNLRSLSRRDPTIAVDVVKNPVGGVVDTQIRFGVCGNELSVHSDVAMQPNDPSSPAAGGGSGGAQRRRP